MYECVICYSLNHPRRTHCQHCGAIPANYSITGQTVVYHDSSLNQILPIVPAYGCERQQRRRVTRAYFRTVPLDYYASPE